MRIGTNPADVTVSKAQLEAVLQMLSWGRPSDAAVMVRNILEQHGQHEAERDAWLADATKGETILGTEVWILEPVRAPKRNNQPDRSWLAGVLAALAELARAIVGRGRR